LLRVIARMSATRPKLSLAMIVKNEARCLERCLRSVRAVVNEIIIVDTGSTDGTIEIARKFDAKISHFDWINDFSAARNFSLDQAEGDWILVLDADEFASEALGTEIREFIQSRSAIGRLKIVSDFRRNGHTLRSQSFVSRLFPRGAHFHGRIHEQVVSRLERVSLRGELWHDGYLDTQKSDRNLKLLLAELEREPDNAYLLHQLGIEYISVDQIENAFQSLSKAFARAKPGDPFAPNIAVDLLYAAMALKKFEAGMEVIGKSAKFLEDFPDFHLARGLFYMNLIRSDPARYAGELPKIEQSFQHCLGLGETDKYKSVRGSGTFLANYNLGVFYYTFGNTNGARKCFETAAVQGYEPAAAMLKKLNA
jgi:glycosyltransferase involved in cell wall biosynthesis